MRVRCNPLGWWLGACCGSALHLTASAATADQPMASTTPAEPGRAVFVADPVLDGAVLSIGGGVAFLSAMIEGTGELRPQQISPSFKTSKLLSIDRVAVTQTIDPNAATLSNVGLITAVGYAVVDPVLSGFREHSATATVADYVMYGEAITATNALTEIAKLAVRRPRPIAYVEFNKCKAGLKPNQDPSIACDNRVTDSALSFFSGHVSTVASISAAATYLAFTRSPHSWRPWATLGGGVALTTWVAYERVRSGAHFPTDVIAASLAGAGVGVIVVHLHRADTFKPKPLWIGWQPAVGIGGAATVNGLF